MEIKITLQYDNHLRKQCFVVRLVRMLTKIVFVVIGLLLCLLHPLTVSATDGQLFNDSAVLDTTQVLDWRMDGYGTEGAWGS